MKKPKRKPAPKYRYTLTDEMFASPVDPLPKAWQTTQLTNMWDGLAQMETGCTPAREDWGIVSDAVNLLEQLVMMGEVEDSQGLLPDAITAMAEAGQRNLKGGAIRLSGPGIQAVRGVLEDYAAVIEVLPARTMIRCHRLTERRIRDILEKRHKLPHDVEVMAL